MEIQIILPERSQDGLSDALREITAALVARDPDEGGYGLGGENGYGAAWDSDVFTMRRFYWGECDCGADERDAAWWDGRSHAPNCYISELRASDKGKFREAISAACDARNKHPWCSPEADAAQVEVDRLSKLERAHETAIAKALCKKHGIPWNKGWGSAVHCTCGLTAEAQAADLGHLPTCSHELPNFRHKASGFEVRWYKWIGRDNETVGDPPPLAAMLAECLADIAAKAEGAPA